MRDFFYQSCWNDDLIADCRCLIQLAIEEDFRQQPDWTTISIVPEIARASASVVARKSGVFVGAHVARLVAETAQADLAIEEVLSDGEPIQPRQTALVIRGNARDLLSLERIILNFAGKLSGIATLTSQFVHAVAGTKAEICDTRKTTAGWRRLEKYAVHCGGGVNHRMGLYDAILIKDNHLAFTHDRESDWAKAIGHAIQAAKRTAAEQARQSGAANPMVIEVEVDTLDQLRLVFAESPDIVLLDNMTNEQLREAVELRNKQYPLISLEASGGVNLGTVRAIAETGVDRISVGALTHSAENFDLGLDWS